jgi:saccharopine dehydrogenase-like NADP-dependent oxidoreductase
MTMRRVLLIGATGVFGSRLATLLAGFDDIELILAARRIEPLIKMRDALSAGRAPHVSAIAFDRNDPGRMSDVAPWAVIDVAGPFQDSDYSVPLAAVNCGAHYIDLSDARAFVAGFPAAVDERARKNGVLAASGASSTPALSQAALTTLVAGWRRIDAVAVAISPGGKAPRGLSVVQAILSYVGQPVRVFDNGQWRQSFGWSGARRIEIPRLGMRLVSLCETPDLDLLPKNFPVGRSALFLAGLELPVMHLSLSALGFLVRWKIVRSLRPLARTLLALARVLDWFGSDGGGMIVQASGRDEQGRMIVARWSLLAEQNSGPNVPVAAAAALIRALRDGQVTAVGAQACTGLLACDAILRELSALPISTRTDESFPESSVLFRRLLGRKMDAMPPSVKTTHDIGEAASFEGRAVARSGNCALARALTRIIGLPASGRYPVSVQIAPDRRGETWTRRFGSARFSSWLIDNSQLGTFEERFGPIRFVFDLKTTPRGMSWQFLRWNILGIPMSNVMAPKIKAAAQGRNGQYQFSVAVAHAWLGLLFAYRGTLRRTSPANGR